MPRASRLPLSSPVTKSRSSSISTPMPPKKRALSTSTTPQPKKPKVFTPPAHWKRQYDLISEMRAAIPAPVDTMGCAVLANPTAPPKTQRFQTLISLMLSSQTLDTVTAPTIWNLQRVLPNGLDLQDMLEIQESELDKLIGKVGFHNKKAAYIKRTAIILRDQFDGDIPDTVEGLCSLPGVGEKMAHLTMSAAWNKTMGIGVDTHVHRIGNILNWVNTSTPEKTRVELESWLPVELWGPVNPLLVGFGQTICLPRVPKCGECKLAEEGICPFAKKGLKMWRERQERKVKVKTEVVAKVEIAKDLKEFVSKSEMANDIVKSETIVTKTKTPVTPIKSSTKVESPLKPVKKEVLAGYQIEHFA